jgi:predicted nucleic acid-binding protein
VTEFFLDTSALLKRYIIEAGTPWIEKIVAPQTANTLHIAQITLVEIMTAVNRRHREGVVPAQAVKDVATILERHVRREYNVVRFTYAIVNEAQRLANLHPLRAYDAVQLASALRINRQTIADGAPALTFVCADTRLLAIAAAEGLATQDPATAS